jgi:hypothetical protein
MAWRTREHMEPSIVRNIPEVLLLTQQLRRHQAMGIGGLKDAVCAFGAVDIGLFELAEEAPLLVSGGELLAATSFHMQWQCCREG